MLAAASAAAAATTTSTTQRLGEGLAGTVAAALQGREGELEKRARPYAWCSGMLSLARCVSLLLHPLPSVSARFRLAAATPKFVLGVLTPHEWCSSFSALLLLCLRSPLLSLSSLA